MNKEIKILEFRFKVKGVKTQCNFRLFATLATLYDQ